MKLALVVLWITGAMSVVFGLGFVFAPLDLAEMITDAVPSSTSAVIDMRATYGGVAAGLGAFLILATRRREWVRPGLVVVTLVMGSVAVARIIGIIADGDPNTIMLVSLATEIVAAVLGGIALRRVRASAG